MKKKKTVPTGVLSPQSIQNAVPMHKNELRIVFGKKNVAIRLCSQVQRTHTKFVLKYPRKVINKMSVCTNQVVIRYQNVQLSTKFPK